MISGVIACDHYRNKDRQLAILISYLNRNYAIVICTIVQDKYGRANNLAYLGLLPGKKKEEIFL